MGLIKGLGSRAIVSLPMKIVQMYALIASLITMILFLNAEGKLGHRS